MKFRFERVIACSRDRVFAFHQNPENLRLLHEGGAALRLLYHENRVCLGSVFWFEITVGGIVPVVLGFRHTLYEPPHGFGEQLVHGPFRRFDHVHEFEEDGANTIVRDLLDVELPRQYGGELAVKWAVAPSLRRAFLARGAALERLARAGRL